MPVGWRPDVPLLPETPEQKAQEMGLWRHITRKVTVPPFPKPGDLDAYVERIGLEAFEISPHNDHLEKTWVRYAWATTTTFEP